MTDILTWYVATTVIGVVGLPLALTVFGPLRSGGVLYARPIALLAVAELAWIVSAITPIPYGLPLVVGSFVVVLAWAVWLVVTRPTLRDQLEERWRILAVGEGVYAGLFLLLAFVRAQTPNAWATEKPFEISLLTTLRRADSMPPLDPWFGGETLSYYHLGHAIIDMVGRIAGIGPGVEFTVGLAMMGALAGAAVFALAGDLLALSPVRRSWTPWVAGAMAVIALFFFATTVGFIDVLSAHDVGRNLWGHLGVDGVPGPIGTKDGAPTQWWWWWRATRVVPGTITEFPAFSFILGDVHPHVLVLPFSATALALAFVSVGEESPRSWRYWVHRPNALLVAGILYAGLAMTNTWDALSFGLLWGVVVLASFVRAGWRPHVAVVLVARHLALPVAAAVIIAMPFIATLATPGPAVKFVVTDVSDPTRFALIWLPLVLPVVVFWFVVRPRWTRAITAYGTAAGLVPIVIWFVAAQVSGHSEAVDERGSGWWLILTLSLTVGLVGAVALAAYSRGERALFAFLTVLVVGVFILLFTELVNFEDRAGGRYNMVFKFWYSVWLLFAIGAGTAVAMAFDRLQRVRRELIAVPALVIAIVICGGSMLYAPAATLTRSREGQIHGLDSLNYLEVSDPSMAAAIRWVDGNLDNDDILLEAVGADYGPGNMVSAASGIPTLLGWAGGTHEMQWRGRIPEIPERQAAVARIYSEGATDAIASLARSYGVTYVYLGHEERVQFGDGVAERFGAWQTVFEAPGVRIVEVPRPPQEVAR